MSGIQLHNIHYNSQSKSFEARVDIRRGPNTYRYPCQISGPKSMDMALVCDHLVQQAKRMSDTGADHYSQF